MKSAHTSLVAPRLAALALLCAPALAQSGAKSAPVLHAVGDVKTPAAPAQKIERSTQHVPAPAQASKSKPAAPAAALHGAPLEHSSVLYRETPGALWARGASYKASFSAQGMTYVPFLGSQAPRDYGLSLSLSGVEAGGSALALASQPVAQREGDVVSLARGPLTEVYRLAPESVEQQFVLAGKPGEGDLALHIAVASELAPVQDAQGLLFSNEHGAVRYGKATVVDAAGARLELAESLADGQIGIDVPASFLARAQYPVTIDPLVSSFSVTSGPDFDSNPDVAYDINSNTYAVVYEEFFSLSDTDVYVLSKTTSGADVPGSLRAVDLTQDVWREAHIADNRIAGNFLIVCTYGMIGTQHLVVSNTYSATGYTLGATQLVCDPTMGDQFNAVVGGDPETQGPTYFMVVWQRYYGSGDQDILGRLVDSSGIPFGPIIPIENSAGTNDDLPAVSKSDGLPPFASQVWTVAWRHEYTAADHDIYAAQLAWDGTIVHPSYVVAATSHDEGAPAVSSPIVGAAERTYMVAYERSDAANDRDLYVDALQGTLWKDSLDVSAAEGWSSVDQAGPSIDADGSQFLVAYSESFYPGSYDYDVYSSHLGFAGNQIVLTAQRELLAWSGDPEWDTCVCAQHSGGATSRSFFVGWDKQGQNDSDVLGAIVDAPIGGPVDEFCFGTAAACPCGNGGAASSGCANSANASGAHLGANGYAVLSADSLQLQASGMPPTATCLFFQGTGMAGGGSGIVLGDGLRCVAGTLIRLGAKTASAGTAVYPQAGDTPISTRGLVPLAGAVRYYQTWYRNPVNFCTSATYNLTNGVRAVWLP
jgi:hypothetical protein